MLEINHIHKKYEDREVLKNVVISIENIVEQDKPPKAIDSKICKKCSYFDLCYV